jgi:hypothetical protein
MNRSTSILTRLAAIVLLLPTISGAQDIMLDRPVSAGDLTLFPSLREDNVYYYVADQARLAEDENGNPQFSMLRYENGGPDTGGGIFHAVVSLEVTESQLQDARRALGQIDASGEIRGPVPFVGGTFALVTSFTADNNQLTRQVVGLGFAPVLDGQKAAVSIQLTDEGARVLWTSLQMATGDLSFSFEMDLDGYRSPSQATVSAEFDEIYTDQSIAAAATTPVLAGEIMAAFENLRQERTIQFDQVGEDEDVSRLAEAAYNKLIEIMYEPTRSSQRGALPTQNEKDDLLDRATKMLTAARKEVREDNAAAQAAFDQRQAALLEARVRIATERREAAMRSSASGGTGTTGSSSSQGSSSLGLASIGVAAPETELVPLFYSESDLLDVADREAGPELEELPAFAAIASYRLKRERRSGTFTFNFNKYTVSKLRMRFDENIGDLNQWANNTDYFRLVDLADLSIERRNVKAYVDGLNADQMRDHLNFVSVVLKKTHGGGSVSTDELRIDAGSFSEQANDFELSYNWQQEDGSGTNWLNYDYEVTWSFRGMDPISESVERYDANSIALRAPYQVRQVTLDVGDPGILADEGVRAVTVRIYDASGEKLLVNETLRPDREPASKVVEFLHDAAETSYPLEMTWQLRGNNELSTGRISSSSNILFLDELPGR